MKKIPLRKTIFVIVLVAVIAVSGLILFKKISFFEKMLAGVVWPVWIGQQTGNKEAVKPVDQPDTTEVLSVDGTMVLIMSRDGKKGQPQTYSFRVKNIAGKSEDKTERLIFTKTIGLGGKMEILRNSWSPDNKYLMLQEQDEFGQKKVLVFKASGQAFANGEQYFDAMAVFNQKRIGWAARDVTGWASPTLVNITTYKEGVENGPAYWLDVGSRGAWQHR